MALIVHMFVPIVLDIGETLQYLFAEREESKDDFVCEYSMLTFKFIMCTYISLQQHVLI